MRQFCPDLLAKRATMADRQCMPLLSPTVDQSLFAQVVEVSADAIFLEDVDGRITAWNAAAERVYGVPAAAMLGCAAADLLPAETVDHLQQVRTAALEGTRVERFDSWHLRPDGRHIAVSVTMSPLRTPDGAVAGLVTSVQDVTERVRLSAELDDAHRTLGEQNAALLRSNRDLQQFAYIASHDLSEPLRVMTGYVQLIERRYADALDERGSRWVQHVVEGAERMRRLIDDLLEYSRFLRTDRTVEAVDLAAAAEQAAARLRNDVPDAVVEIGPLPPVLADRSALDSVLANVLGNAAKFHRPGAAPHVVVSAERDGGFVRLVVDDDGIGIEPAYRERVFRMFQRLHAREEFDGTGIGLAIVQQVAESCGGRAWVEDSPLGGARVCVTVRAAAQEVR